MLFSIRDGVGEFIFVKSRILGNISSLEAETITLRTRLEYCVSPNLLSIVLETDSILS